MAKHPEWCGKPCAECEKPCALDENMPCSPDCDEFGFGVGEPKCGDICKECDALR